MPGTSVPPEAVGGAPPSGAHTVVTAGPGPGSRALQLPPTMSLLASVALEPPPAPVVPPLPPAPLPPRASAPPSDAVAPPAPPATSPEASPRALPPAPPVPTPP